MIVVIVTVQVCLSLQWSKGLSGGMVDALNLEFSFIEVRVQVSSKVSNLI